MPLKKDPIAIRWHGRGGQGAVTASKILAEAGKFEDKYFLGLPDYGAEREGAPISSYTKLSSKPIRDLSVVPEPDVVVVLDPTLLEEVNVLGGLSEDNVLIVNTSESPDQIRSKLGYKGEIYTVDATSISMENLGRDLPNIPILGSIVRAVEIVGKDNLAKMIRESLSAKFKEKIVEGNMSAFEKAYDVTQAG